MITTATINFRKASFTDAGFLIDAIIASEKSGSNIFSFSSIFGITEPQFRNILMEILEEDVTGQEWCISDYLILELEGKPAGTLCAWVEGSGLKTSSIMKGTLMQYFFPKEAIDKAQQNKALIDAIAFNRTQGTLIVDSVYIADEFRSRGLFRKLLEVTLNNCRELNPEVKICNLTVLKSNQIAIKAYLNAGFNIVTEKVCENPNILMLLPSNTRVLMQKSI